MGRVITSFCCLAVGLQILIGVPLAVCIAFFVVMQGGTFVPVSIEIHGGSSPPTTVEAPGQIADVYLPPPPLPGNPVFPNPQVMSVPRFEPSLPPTIEQPRPEMTSVSHPPLPSRDQALIAEIIEA